MFYFTSEVRMEMDIVAEEISKAKREGNEQRVKELEAEYNRLSCELDIIKEKGE